MEGDNIQNQKKASYRQKEIDLVDIYLFIRQHFLLLTITTFLGMVAGVFIIRYTHQNEIQSKQIIIDKKVYFNYQTEMVFSVKHDWGDQKSTKNKSAILTEHLDNIYHLKVFPLIRELFEIKSSELTEVRKNKGPLTYNEFSYLIANYHLGVHPLTIKDALLEDDVIITLTIPMEIERDDLEKRVLSHLNRIIEEKRANFNEQESWKLFLLESEVGLHKIFYDLMALADKVDFKPDEFSFDNPSSIEKISLLIPKLIGFVGAHRLLSSDSLLNYQKDFINLKESMESYQKLLDNSVKIDPELLVKLSISNNKDIYQLETNKKGVAKGMILTPDSMNGVNLTKKYFFGGIMVSFLFLFFTVSFLLLKSQFIDQVLEKTRAGKRLS